WSTVAYGARAVNIYAYYPMSSGYEGGGYGLVELDGKITERAVEAGRIAGLISAHQDLFLGSLPAKAEIAILYNPLAHMVGGQQAFTSEGQSIGYNSLSESLQGIHRAFYERHIPVDFLHVRDLVPERWKDYKLLVVPYPVMMSQTHVRALIEYVRSGGTIVAEARCGWVDEHGFSSPVIPGGGLADVFGCRESELKPLAKTAPMTIAAADESLPLLKAGDKLDALFFEEAFDVFGPSSRILARFENGTPAMVASTFGKGKALIVGSFPGSAYHHFKNPANGAFFAGLADWVGVRKPVVIESSDPEDLIEGRILEGSGYRLLIGFNRGDRKTAAAFALPVFSKNPAVRELESGRNVTFRRDDDGVVIEKELAPGDVWVVVIEDKE
ncbi:MAG: beta-galactosidase trimerization domain-containing protein, partial [Candidatus Aminicenantales bacterium]